MNILYGCLGQELERKKFLFWSWDSYKKHTWELDYICQDYQNWRAGWKCTSCEQTKFSHHTDQQLMIKFGLSKKPKGGILLPSDLDEYR